MRDCLVNINCGILTWPLLIYALARLYSELCIQDIAHINPIIFEVPMVIVPTSFNIHIVQYNEILEFKHL